MKIFSSCQKAVEKKVASYINELARYEEKAQLEHEIQCGELLRESDNLASIEAYRNWKHPAKINSDSTSSVIVTGG